MEAPKMFKTSITLLSVILAISIVPVYSQISTPCTASMITSFTPCMNFITGSSANGTSPTTQCCGSFKSLLGTGMECACLLLTANVPFQLPINRTLALSLPRACNMGGVPVQCKASVSPLPAPGPVSTKPAPSPSADTSSPTGSTIPEATSPALAPKPETTNLTPLPAFSPAGSDTPVANRGVRPVLTPNAAAKLSCISFPSLLIVLGAFVLDQVYWMH